MAQTYQEYKVDILKKAQAGTLTIGEALEFTLDKRTPLPASLTKKVKPGAVPGKAARSRIAALRGANGIPKLAAEHPDVFPKGLDTPLKDMRSPDITMLFQKIGSADKSNRAYNYQTFENIFFHNLPSVSRFVEKIDAELEPEEMYPRLAGQDKPMGTQRTGMVGAQPMRGTITKEQIDAMYEVGLPAIEQEYGPKTRRLIEYHRYTFNRIDQLIELTKDDVVISDDKITILGKDGGDNKNRPELSFKRESPVGKLVLDSYNESSSNSLFDVPEDKFSAAFNKHIGNQFAEKYSKLVPLHEVKKYDKAGKVTSLAMEPLTTPSVIRSAVPHYLLKMKIDSRVVEGLMGHVDSSTLAKYYTGTVLDEELSNVLQFPENYSDSPLSKKTKKKKTGVGEIEIDDSFLTEEQKTKLADSAVETALAENTAKRAGYAAETAAAQTVEGQEQIKRAETIDQEVEARKLNIAADAEVKQAESEAADKARFSGTVKSAEDSAQSFFSNFGKATTKFKSTAFAALSALPLGPVDVVLSAFTTDKEKVDKAEEIGRQTTADLFGIPREPGERVGATRPVAGVLPTIGGGIAAATEAIGQTVFDKSLVADGEFFPSDSLQERSQRLMRNVTRPIPGGSRLNLPPVPEAKPQGMLEAGDAPSKVQEAEDRARSGQSTSMLDIQPLTI